MYEYFPQLVTRDKDGEINSINYGGFTAVLLEGMKAQKVEIDELKQQNQDLKKALCSLHPELELCK